MGADLLVSVVEIRETEEQARERLTKLVIDESFIQRFMNAGYYFWEEEEFTEEVAKDMRKRISDSIDIVYGQSRGINLISLDGNRILAITGGMSWGDNPTDEFEDFNIFQEFLAYPSWYSPDSDEIKHWIKEGE